MSKVTYSALALGVAPRESGSSILSSGNVPLPLKSYSGLSAGGSRLWLMPIVT
jgi:hypothetical protein